MNNLEVLVVAEPDTIGGVISKILRKKGFDVTVVDVQARPEKVHAELSQKKYNLILLTNNVLSPRQIQALVPKIKRQYPSIKIIVVSGWKTPEFIRDLREKGVDDFLPLPLVFDDLLQKVTSIFDQENRIKEAQKKLIWAELSYKKKFRCEVIGYDGNNYRVKFSNRGGLIAIESIPRKEIDEFKSGGRNSPSLEELFGWVEQVTQGKGKS